MHKKLFLLIFITAIFALPSFAQDGTSTGLSFLKLGTTAREQALGETGVASALDASANYWNPSLLVQSPQSSVLFSQNLWIFDTYSSYAAIDINRQNYAIGVAVNWNSINDIQIRSNPTTEPDGLFNANYAAIGVSYARKFAQSFSLAVTGKFLYEKIYLANATGYAVDLSASEKLFNDRLTLGAVVANLGKMGVLEDEASKLPTLARLGGAYQLDLASVQSSALLEANLATVFSGSTHVNLGAELGLKKFIWARAGYQIGNDGRNFSAGIGLLYHFVKFDYAFVPLTNSLGNASLLTVQIQY
jgi:hypothetical protein